MAIAREHKEVIITHDLDFGTQLAFSHLSGPSVILFRLHQINAQIFHKRLTEHWNDMEEPLKSGALIVIEPAGIRVRLLPI